MNTRHDFVKRGYCNGHCDKCDQIIESRTIKASAREQGTNARLVG